MRLSRRRGRQGKPARKLYTMRAELRLALDDRFPLATDVLNPDPMGAFARAMNSVDVANDETAEIHLDLLPVSAWQQRRRRLRQATHTVKTPTPRPSSGGGGRELAQALWHGPFDTRRSRAGASAPGEDAARRDDRSAVSKKLLAAAPMWQAQVLVRVRSPHRGRAKMLLTNLLAGFNQFTGTNNWAVVGTHFGLDFLGADMPWRRRSFDRRADTGLWRPVGGGSWVSSDEIAALLVPPTRHCHAPNLVRGIPVDPAPKDLPVYRGPGETPQLMPLGWVEHDGVYRPAGVPKEGLYFQAMAGGAGSGKTEWALAGAIHVAHSQPWEGLLYVDPHEDANERLKTYLGRSAGRVLEFNFAHHRSPNQAGWNLLSMTGRTAADIEIRTAAVVSSFGSALNWGVTATRATTLTTKAAESLCELGLQLPADTQPTIFQMVTILTNEDWREAVLPFLSPAVRDFWLHRFPRMASEAVTPVTNLLDRLRSSPPVAALFGASQSTYDMRRAMDAGQIVLACPTGYGDKDRLIACFFLFDLLTAALSRRDTPEAQRRRFWLWCDELQRYDSAGIVTRMLQEIRKFEARASVMTQSLNSLTERTRDALLTNRSNLLSGKASADDARLFAREFGNKDLEDALAQLPRYHSIAQVTLHDRPTAPFLVRGFHVDDVYAEYRDADAPAIDAAVNTTLRRRPIHQTLAELDTLDDRILAQLHAHRPDGDDDSGGGPDDGGDDEPGTPSALGVKLGRERRRRGTRIG